MLLSFFTRFSRFNASKFPVLLRTALSLSGGVLLPFASPAIAAERIFISYNFLERSVPISSLEAYARDGTIDENLAGYARYASPQVLQQLRSVLQARVDLSPVAVSQFLYSPQGEVLLGRVGQVVRSEGDLSGFKGIRAALILAAADPQGLTLLNFLRKFPTRSIRIDVERSLDIAAELQRLLQQTNQVTVGLERLSNQQAATEPPIGPGFLEDANDPRLRGPYTWQRQTINLVDLNRKPVATPIDAAAGVRTEAPTSGRFFQTDIYLPEGAPQPAPVIVISHGLGSDRTTFTYLAQHLVSHGFAVLVPEHPGSNAKQMEALLNGLVNEVAEPSEFVDRPLDVTFLLDQLERQVVTNPALKGQLDLQRVGVIGQSFGGYTALVLGGASINNAELLKQCPRQDDTLNLSLLLQCRASQLGQTSGSFLDDRVKAVVAINPITSAVLGEAGIRQIQVPTMILSGNADTVAPALVEQIQPFTWLNTPDKYLVLIEQGTHFSVLNDIEQGSGALQIPPEAIGPSPQTARRYVNALSLSFFRTYVAGTPGHRQYLTARYAQLISEPPLRLNLLTSLTADQLATVLKAGVSPSQQTTVTTNSR